MRPTTFWSYENFGSTRNANAELKHLLEGESLVIPSLSNLLSKLSIWFQEKKQTISSLIFFVDPGQLRLPRCSLMLKMVGTENLSAYNFPNPAMKSPRPLREAIRLLLRLEWSAFAGLPRNKRRKFLLQQRFWLQVL